MENGELYLRLIPVVRVASGRPARGGILTEVERPGHAITRDRAIEQVPEAYALEGQHAPEAHALTVDAARHLTAYAHAHVGTCDSVAAGLWEKEVRARCRERLGGVLKYYYRDAA